MGLTKSNIKVDGKTKEQIEAERQAATEKSQGKPQYVESTSPSVSSSLSPSTNSNPTYTIVTSWDDGNLLDLKIVEFLKKYNLPGTFYIIVDMVGKENYLTWEQIKDIERQGFEIGSHTVSHPSDLKALFDEQLHYEIQNSKDMIETVLGHPISKFCYPRGRYNERVRTMVAQAGYLEARVTGTPGISVIKDKLAIPGTIHIFDRYEYGQQTVTEFAKSTIDRVKKEGGYINIWGHSLELQKFSLWGVLEEILAYATKD